MRLAQTQWPMLAQDLAVMTLPGASVQGLPAVMRTYGLDDVALREVLQVPYFQALLERELEKCQSLGSEADSVYRFASLSRGLSEHLYRDALSGELASKDAVKLLELFMKAARQLDTKEQNVNVTTQVGIALPLPTGLSNPKLQHLEVSHGAAH